MQEGHLIKETRREKEDHLQRKQEQESLHTVKAAINKVAHEEVVCLGTLTTHFEQFHEVEELSMDVTTCASMQPRKSAQKMYAHWEYGMPYNLEAAIEGGPECTSTQQLHNPFLYEVARLCVLANNIQKY